MPRPIVILLPPDNLGKNIITASHSGRSLHGIYQPEAIFIRHYMVRGGGGG